MKKRKQKIYEVAMRLCRMWGVAETLEKDIRPYEDQKNSRILSENKQQVLFWAEEFIEISNVGYPLSTFFEEKVLMLRKKEDEEEEEQLPFPDDTFPPHLSPTKNI